MKQTIKIYLTPEEKKQLESKAIQCGFTGRGSVSHFISKIANEDICFLDQNLKKMLKILLPSL